ncbi:hypothetical protein FGG12_17625 [Cupriavidus campinensis]|uniref:Uncharacterized protein n=1 Tax=Cupriavidus campinensis TaxID=151783 RepID=A0ABY3EKY3_9BURK|nr:hypothetical protein FGG12_17625 [Cupriavidus campinensis]
MSEQKTAVTALLPTDEARDLVLRAAAQGVATPEWLGYLILLSAYGPLHPEVLAFERRAKLGQDGTQQG